MQHFDVAIVGQGIAGTVLAHTLRNKGLKPLIINKDHPNSSSRVAAGLVNPVTGRRFVISWNFEKFNNAAKPFYLGLQDQWETALVHDLELLRIIDNQGNMDQIYARCDEAPYNQYLKFIRATDEGYEVEVRQVYRVDIGQILDRTKKEFYDKTAYLDIFFDHDQLICLENNFKYGDYSFDNIVFCEGYRAKDNPFFRRLPFELSKGEVLLAESELPLTKPIKRKIFDLPIGNNIAWIGPTNTWDFADDKPTASAAEELNTYYEKHFGAKLNVKNHLSAIRPTTIERKPFVCIHPNNKRMFMLNGLGTKGTLLAPLMCENLSAHIVSGEMMPSIFELTTKA